MSSKTYLKLLLASFLVGIGISMVACGVSGKRPAPAPPVTGVFSQL